MAYEINRTNGSLYVTIADGTVDTSSGLALIGQNFHNYGELVARNFLMLLENQANNTQPVSPVAGQLWWDTANKVLNFFDGNRFKPASSSAIGLNPPIAPINGDQWWDLNAYQLKVWDDTQWLVIGPVYARGQGVTGATLTTVTDTNSYQHTIALLQVNGDTIGALSEVPAFNLSTPIFGMTTIVEGITLIPNAMLYSTSLNSQQLGAVAAINYARTDIDSTFTSNITVTGTSGLTVGRTGNTKMYSDAFGNQHVDASIGSLVLEAGATRLTINPATNEITTTTTPTGVTGVANKGYVDTTVLNANTVMTSYVNSSISSVIAGSPLSTLNALSTALGNDPSYYVNTNAKLGLKANIHNPVFTGNVTVAANPTVPLQVATKGYVDSAITAYDIAHPIVNIPNSSLSNSSVTVGNTVISLGSTSTTLTGLTSVTSNSINGTLINGLVATSSQPNITTVGPLTTLTVAGATTLSGSSTAQTVSPGDSSTKVATTEFVSAAVAAAVASAVAAVLAELVGQVGYFPTSVPPLGWLKANGVAVSRTTYANLFAMIGTTYGNGNGSTTFNVPDLRSEFIRGWDDGRGVDSGRGLGSYQADELKSHSHTQQGAPLARNGPHHGTGETSWGSLGYQTATTGGAETRPRNIALLACIKY